ncbi:MAG: class I SAM-dependent rRNA methyltransferase [Planctomycetes bacterium]|nr:class I SAM-dependent rRNA methyltransferase [Planctomycetota bacterium]
MTRSHTDYNTIEDLAPAAPSRIPSVWLRSSTWNPIIYRKRIERVDNGIEPGSLVRVRDAASATIGFGFYNPKAEVTVRMLSFGADPPDAGWWRERLASAVALRRDQLRLDDVTSAYRVIHAEGDYLSGLVVDRYADVLSAEAYSLAMHRRAVPILEQIGELLGTRHWILRGSPHLLAQEGFDAEPTASPDCPPQTLMEEAGTKYRVRFRGGHKTGFFCDQRDNRARLADLCRGRTVLDLCCYSGGFAVHAKRLGAAEVTAVDIDEEPLRLAKENANLNQVRVQFAQSDAFAYMRDMLRNGRSYDVIVLDPPKLIHGRLELEEGTRKHFDLNRLAMQLVRPGGLLLTCSCSGLLTWSEFQKLLVSASLQSGSPYTLPDGRVRHASRPLQFLGTSGAAADHPTAANCPESEYLRAYWLRLG